ncbi:MAG: chorismate synthase [Rikenellaceae bacterium]
MNSFGRIFRVSIWGESHGIQIGVSIDGVRAGLPLSAEDFERDIERRRSGKKGTTPRKESDRPQIVAGHFQDHATGAPMTIVFENENTISKDYSNLVNHPRPSHADRVAQVKYGGWQDYRGGGHFSGRITLPVVAAGVVAKKMLEKLAGEVAIESEIVELAGVSDRSQFDQIVEQAVKSCDSVGGVIECRIKGIPTGIGEPFFDSVESVIAHILFSIPAVKGVEFGAGFESTRKMGSTNNDMILSSDGETSTNNAGGINGGITNSNEIVVRVALKPTPSIASEQMTYNTLSGKVEPLVIHGRHDACIALRTGVVVEAAMAIALTDLMLCAQPAIK